MVVAGPGREGEEVVAPRLVRLGLVGRRTRSRWSRTVVVDGHEALGPEDSQGRRGRAEHPVRTGQRVGQLAMTQMGEALVPGGLDDLGSFARGDHMRAHLGDRRDVGEVGFRQCLRVAASDPTAHPAGIDHQDLAALRDRHSVHLGIGDGPNEEAFDLRRKTRPADGPGQTPSVFPRSKVFSMASSRSALLVR